MNRCRTANGSCRALSASAAALILHYGLGAMRSCSQTSKRHAALNLSHEVRLAFFGDEASSRETVVQILKWELLIVSCGFKEFHF